MLNLSPPTPPPPPPSKNRRDGSPNRDSDDDDDESPKEMRCRCDMDHAEGDTVECEQCKKWQHMACMGLKMKNDVRKYKCEVCMPRKLVVSKGEAVQMQKKVLKKLKTQEGKKGREAQTLQDHNGNRSSLHVPSRTETIEMLMRSLDESRVSSDILGNSDNRDFLKFFNVFTSSLKMIISMREAMNKEKGQVLSTYVCGEKLGEFISKIDSLTSFHRFLIDKIEGIRTNHHDHQDGENTCRKAQGLVQLKRQHEKLKKQSVELQKSVSSFSKKLSNQFQNRVKFSKATEEGIRENLKKLADIERKIGELLIDSKDLNLTETPTDQSRKATENPPESPTINETPEAPNTEEADDSSNKSIGAPLNEYPLQDPGYMDYDDGEIIENLDVIRDDEFDDGYNQEDQNEKEKDGELSRQQSPRRRRVALQSGSTVATPIGRSPRRLSNTQAFHQNSTISTAVPAPTVRGQRMDFVLQKRKLIMPTTPDTHLRRSKRIRLEPVRSWLGERALYEVSPSGGKSLKGVSEVIIKGRLRNKI